MRLVKQSAEYIPQQEGIGGIRKQIEKAGRICYKSEDKITEDSSKEFVKRIIDNGHYAMLEHGTVYLKISHNDDFGLILFINPYTYCAHYDDNDYCTTNLRVLKEHDAMWVLDKYLCEPLPEHEKRHTMHLTTSIGIVRELLRHRKFSFANESTRYCAYNKDKFGNELTFIWPYWLNKDTPSSVKVCYAKILADINDFYIGATNGKLKTTIFRSPTDYEERINEFIPLQAQQVRGILPLDIKSELVMTGFESDWKRFFDLRLYGKTGKPHPDMLILAQLIKDEFEKNGIKL